MAIIKDILDAVDSENKAASERLIEVELVRKYTPVLAYERHDDRYVPNINPSTGRYLRQSEVVIGETKDSKGQSKPIFREVMQTVPPGTRLLLLADEAQRVVRLHVADTTEHSFDAP